MRIRNTYSDKTVEISILFNSPVSRIPCLYVYEYHIQTKYFPGETVEGTCAYLLTEVACRLPQLHSGVVYSFCTCRSSQKGKHVWVQTHFVARNTFVTAYKCLRFVI